ncbi:phenylalanyl-tRNA synthetase [Laetiporus sulphureus 93-53]|uniref:Phenylalanine--tRNA ligase, mitochondrial n=1 Tax=Laetiporus sulphureus 93-53 TaxID=1314785 RepID=A0A165FXI7_9APHY|nr:phenylalanyl-tRNA synthetase [Laetiporus sulphureus 93-53]KZT09547.1 phenylalanyl-tRNA synthetase [Laetiporus sulphureus 93-53]
MVFALCRVRCGFQRSLPSSHVVRRCLSTPASHPETVQLLGKEYPSDSHTNITPTVAEKLNRNLYLQSAHPLGILRSLIESHFTDFAALSGLSPLVTPGKNFDDLGFPLDHPGRALSDSYYINRDLMLRTHTSAHEVEVYARGERRWLLSADVYRRDEIDASHYPVFHQMEGARVFPASAAGVEELEDSNARLSEHLSKAHIVIEDVPHITPSNPAQPTHDPRTSSLVAQNLKLSLNSLMLALFGGRAGASEDPLRVRWIEAYFPFTSPSYEVEVFFHGKWLEILGCGVVQQQTLDRANVPNNVSWAFGLGLERIAMILFSIPDIRLFWSQDPRFLSQFAEGQITTFKPYSKHPPCYKDVSFWVPDGGLHDNDVFDLVRDIVGDVAEDVKLIDSFTHPKTNRTSRCYRINYRSMDRSLSNEEANVYQAGVLSRLQEKFGVEIR